MSELEIPSSSSQKSGPSSGNRSSSKSFFIPGVEIRGEMRPEFAEILTPEAVQFIADLHRKFAKTRQSLLKRRTEVQRQIDAGWRPDFLPETASVRAGNWKVAPIPADIQDRRVEITGPVDRKMIINALNSGARVFMADFEDSHTPTWAGTLEGQINLRDAVRRTITYQSPEGKTYQLLKPTDAQSKTAVLFVRPRGWHLGEKHVFIDGEMASGSLFDFGLTFFHNAKESLRQGTGPYYYLPKLENYLEARLWNDVFAYSQAHLELPIGTIRATVLIETILAAFQMDEILFELREHSAGLNCGRWDYIFSFIKKFNRHRSFLMPDRAQVTMTSHFLRSYSKLLIQTCHRRGIHAMGGMAAQIPIKGNEEANTAAMEKVRADKLREVTDGHDGTWVAHPGLVPIAQEIFDAHMKTPNQIARPLETIKITADDLLRVPTGEITEAGFRNNTNVTLIYLESWLRGVGCVPIHNLMEDAATAEIARTQLWQWVHHGAKLSDGRVIDFPYFDKVLHEEEGKLKAEMPSAAWSTRKFSQAKDLLTRLVRDESFTEFLTLPAYDNID